MAPKRPVKRLVATIFVVALCFCAICGKVLLDARKAAWDRAAQAATSLAVTIESDIVRTIESYDLSLQAVVENLAYPEITQISPELRQLVLFDRSSTAKHLDAIVLLDENGIVRLDSRTPFPKPVSRAERDYFQFHKSSKVPKLHISEPIIARETGNRVITISRRLSNPDGSFAGVIAGSLRHSYFQKLFKDASFDPRGNITLARMDGMLLARWPYDEAMLGRDLNGSDLYKQLATARSGRFETAAMTDGIQRLVVYSQIGDLPLVIGVGQSTDGIYAQWRAYALTIGLLMVMLCVTTAGLGWFLFKEMNRRDAAEASLAMLATTDGLTGLFNRRFFNEALDREWRRAVRERNALALVMCDTDLFKSYNDRHGHQAGDRLLQAIGASMNQSIRRGTDVAARYGGDEFAILLPSTATEGAAMVAAEVRKRLVEVCDREGIPRSHLSIGIASIVPDRGDDQGSLIAAADQALYQAKELGRDRIELAPRRPRKLALIENLSQHSAA
jgi:diguanylate cyclase (GGDEF)-like protein